MTDVKFAAADVTGLAGVLEQHGFTEEDQVLLTDDAATKTVVESKIRRTTVARHGRYRVLLLRRACIFQEWEELSQLSRYASWRFGVDEYYSGMGA